MENHYIREWIEYYLNLGVDKIFLYDNNDINGEKFEDEINIFINSRFVELIDWKGKNPDKLNLQSLSYLDCYQNRANNYDYLGFFDIDEFLYIGENVKIYEYLSLQKFKNFECIRFPMFIMDDNDLIKVKNNNYSLQSRFTRGKLVSNCKSIMKTGITKINSIKVINAHGPIGLSSCDPNGIECNNGLNTNIGYPYLDKKVRQTKEFVKHFRYKTLQEYIEIKMKRLYPDRTFEDSKRRITLENFFKFNKITKDKINYIKSKGFSFNLNKTEKI